MEAVQVLTDLNLSIKKAYICSDGRFFMDGESSFLTEASVKVKWWGLSLTALMYSLQFSMLAIRSGTS